MKRTIGNFENEYALATPSLISPGGMRVIEIHPTHRCNLKCLHCYSESLSDSYGDLVPEDTEGFFREAAELGFNYVGVSGGEPLLWDGLHEFLQYAGKLGFSTAITTNGTLLNETSINRLRDHVGLVSVSVDGPPEQHAIMRNSTTAFDLMHRGIKMLKKAEVPFTLAFTLTRHNAGQLSWLYDFARQEGAMGLHVHPLCPMGAASTNLSEAIPDSLEFKISSYLLALLSDQNGPGGPIVTLDAMKRVTIEKSSWTMLNGDHDQIMSAPFVDIVPSLVVENDGSIVPFIYDFPRRWAIGNICEGGLSEQADNWRKRFVPTIAKLLRTTLDRLAIENAAYVDLLGELLVTAREN